MEQLNLFEQTILTLPPFVVVDVETTGKDSKEGYIIEIGAKRDDGEIFETLVRPKIPIPEVITGITGITQDMLNLAPDGEEVFPKFFEFMGDRILIAHNAPFDRGFLMEEARRYGIVYAPDFIDTASIGRLLLPNLPHVAGKSRYTLENMITVFGIKNENAHRALSDVEATYTLFMKHLWPLCIEKSFNPVNQYEPSRQNKKIW